MYPHRYCSAKRAGRDSNPAGMHTALLNELRHTLMTRGLHYTQGVTKRCRLSWLTNSALVYEPICGMKGELLGLRQ
jgi:hypothetical protein